MKNSIAILALLVVLSLSSAQSQDTGSVTKYNVSTLSNIIYDTVGNVTHNTTFRAAIETKVTYLGIDFVARGVYTTQVSGPFGQLWAEKKIGNYKISAGYQGRPLTLVTRPNPIYGHFEAPSTSIIPGSATGINIYGNFNTVSVISGVCYLPKDKQPQYGLALQNTFSPTFTVAVGGYYSANNYGVGSKIAHEWFTLLGYYEKKKEASVFAEINLPILPYLTMNYNHVTKEVSNLEVGITKTFETPLNSLLKIKTLLGGGYEFKSKTTALFVFIHL